MQNIASESLKPDSHFLIPWLPNAANRMESESPNITWAWHFEFSLEAFTHKRIECLVLDVQLMLVAQPLAQGVVGSKSSTMVECLFKRCKHLRRQGERFAFGNVEVEQNGQAAISVAVQPASVGGPLPGMPPFTQDHASGHLSAHKSAPRRWWPPWGDLNLPTRLFTGLLIDWTSDRSKRPCAAPLPGRPPHWKRPIG